MRKTLKTILILAMALALCCNAAFASSKTSVAEITEAVDEDGNDVVITESESSVDLSEEKAADILGNIDAEDLKVVSVKDLESDTLPVTITFNVDSENTLYVFHYEGSAWKFMGKGDNGTATVTFDSLSPVGLVLGKSASTTKGSDKKADSSKSGKSYKTGEDSIVLGGCAVALAAGVVAVVSRKKEA